MKHLRATVAALTLAAALAGCAQANDRDILACEALHTVQQETEAFDAENPKSERTLDENRAFVQIFEKHTKSLEAARNTAKDEDITFWLREAIAQREEYQRWWDVKGEYLDAALAAQEKALDACRTAGVNIP